MFLLLIGCQVSNSIFKLEPKAEVAMPNAFDDGWSVEIVDVYSFIEGVELIDLVTDETTYSSNGSWLINWMSPEEPILEQIVASARWGLSYVHSKPSSSATHIGTIDDDIRLTMLDSQHGMWIAGQAEKGEELIEFELLLDLPVQYIDCHDGSDGYNGVNLIPESSSVELNWYLRSAFLTSLTYGVEDLAFQAIADADINEDGLVETSEIRLLNPEYIGYDRGERIADRMDQFIAISLAQGLRVNRDGLCTMIAL